MTREEYYEAVEHDNRELSLKLYALRSKIDKIEETYNEVWKIADKEEDDAIEELIDKQSGLEETSTLLSFFAGVNIGMDRLYKAIQDLFREETTDAEHREN